MPKQTAAFAKVPTLSRVVNLKSVCWREITAKRFVEQAHVPPKMECSGGYEAQGHRDVEGEEIVVLVQFRFRAEMKEPPSQVAEVGATLALRYSIDDGSVKAFEPGLVQAFAETNGVYNAWPYWRELLQSSTDRIGLHGVIAPVFRLLPAPRKDAKQEAEK